MDWGALEQEQEKEEEVGSARLVLEILYFINSHNEQVNNH